MTIENKVTYEMNKEMPDSIKIIQECAFNMFMYEYKVNDKTPYFTFNFYNPASSTVQQYLRRRF